jgi:Zn-dependent alcohol dehydrogenase
VAQRIIAVREIPDVNNNRNRLDDIARGFDDMHAGKSLRGVVVFD